MGNEIGPICASCSHSKNAHECFGYCICVGCSCQEYKQREDRMDTGEVMKKTCLEIHRLSDGGYAVRDACFPGDDRYRPFLFAHHDIDMALEYIRGQIMPQDQVKVYDEVGVYDPCGCVFCDLGLDPTIPDAGHGSVHRTKRGWVACTRKKT